MLKPDIIREATRLTQAGQLAEATALLQRMLRGGDSATDATSGITDRIALSEPSVIDVKANPVADVTYLGGIAADPAKDAGVLTPYNPKGWEKIPADLKDPDGFWFTIHSGTLGLFVNKAALGGKPVPESWADLLKPEYANGQIAPEAAALI